MQFKSVGLNIKIALRRCLTNEEDVFLKTNSSTGHFIGQFKTIITMLFRHLNIPFLHRKTGSGVLNPGAVFVRFVTVAFLLFLAPAGVPNPVGPIF